MPSWMIYFNLIASSFWAIQFTFALLWHKKHKKHSKQVINETPFLSVVIPVYNESNNKIQNVVNSTLNQKDVKTEIFVVDDGSDTPLSIQSNPQVHLIHLPVNKGKRFAQIEAIKKAKSDWIVTIDSDTTVEPDALSKLYKGMIAAKADAMTGTIVLQNEKQNVLTKMTACLYWYGFSQERGSHGYVNQVNCCSGALSIYRKETILEHADEYLEQEFLGTEVEAGDDRFLTTLFACNGKKIGYAIDAIGHTHSPAKLGEFCRQQLRWARSYPPCFFYILRRWKQFSPWFLFFAARMAFRYSYFAVLYGALLVHLVLYQDYMIMPVILGTVLAVSLVKAVVAWGYTREWKFLWMLPLSMFSFFVLTPIVVYGAFTPIERGWLTRSKAYKGNVLKN